MQNSVAKKFFAVGSAAAMALAVAAPMTAFAAAHAEGTNVNKSGTVGMIIGGQFRPYTSAGAFLSYGFNSWSSVVEANADDNALPVGSFIPPQDGKIICSDRGSDKGTCYLITGSQKAGFTSAAVFTGLGFSFSRAMYGDVSWMTSTSNIDNTTAAHRPGVLVNNNGTVQLMGNSGLLGIPDLATFNSWGYSFNDVVPANAADKAMTQTGVMASRVAGQLSPTSLANPGTPPASSGSVSVSLASDTPVAQTVAVGSTYRSVVTLGKFTFTGSGTVTQAQFKRIGVSADTILSNVYLFDGGTRLTDAASVGGSSIITFNNPNGLFTVSGSRTISVVAEIAAGTSSGQTVGAQLVSYTVSGGSAASVSVTGNLFTVSSSTDLAYATFGTVTPGDSASQTRDPAKDVEVFRSSVSVNNRDMQLSRFIVRNIGSAQQADINNFRLRVDGTQVAQTQSMDANGYVTFSFSPLTLKAGSRVFSILADIVGGSSRTFQFQVRNIADVDFMDTQYGVSVAPSNTFPVGSGFTVSIQSGTLTIQKATDSPSGNVTDNSSDVTLAKYTVTAYGEAMKIETIKVGVTSSDANVGSLRNGRVLVNGAQYGSTATLAKTAIGTVTFANSTSYTGPYGGGGTTYTLNYTVQPGTPVTIEVRADMYDNDGTNHLGNSDTVTAYVMPNGSNVQKMVSLGYTDSNTSPVAGNSVQDVTGSMTVAKNATYANQKAPLPQVGYKLGSFTLTGSSSEDITINTLDVGVRASSSVTSLYNVKVMVNGNMFGTQKGTASAGTWTVAATSSYSGTFTLAKGATATVEVYGDVNAPTVVYSSDKFAVDLGVSGTTVNSSATVTGSAAGQTISVGAADIAATQDPSTPVAAIVAGNQTKTAAAFRFTTTNDQYTISEVVLTLAANTTVNQVVLKDGSTVLATQPGQATVTFSGLSIPVTANSNKVLTVDLVLGNVGIGAGQSGENVKVTLSSFKSAPSSTGTIGTTSPSSVTGNNMYVVKSVPTVTNVSLPTGTLVAGTNTLSKFSISSGGTGIVSWTRIVFTVSSSSGVTVTSPTVWDADTNTQVTGTPTITLAGSTTIAFDALNEQEISGAKNYVLKATVGKTSAFATGDYITTNIAQGISSFASPTTASGATGTAATFVWSDETGSYTTGTVHSLLTHDWFSDNLVKNIPTDSQTLTK